MYIDRFFIIKRPSTSPHLSHRSLAERRERQRFSCFSLSNNISSLVEPCNEGKEPHVVIAGGGIVGASLAYYLTKKGVKPIVIERNEVAAAASGKAGGFLAKKWGDGTKTEALHRLSFDLHEQLSSELGIESYRRISTLGVSFGNKGSSHASWLNATSKLIDTETAQVTPYEYTTKVMQAAINQGARLVIGSVTAVETTDAGDGKSKAVSNVRVRVDDKEGQGHKEVSIAAKQVAVCLGPWSVLAEDWFKNDSSLRVPIEGIRSTSVVFRDDEIEAKVKHAPFALFCAEDPKNGTNLEVYPRNDGSVYVCGIGGSDYVSGARLREGGDCEHQGLIKANPKRVKAAMDSLASIASIVKGKEPVMQQACMRPCAPDAIPIMGGVPNVEGAFISAGHNCWGILWGPVSGLAMSELMVDGASSTVDLSPFDPSRFTEKGLRGGLPQNLQEDDERGRHSMDQPVGEQW
jgi:glycine/D-amino acid oxidase-like deaminating enzyme